MRLIKSVLLLGSPLTMAAKAQQPAWLDETKNVEARLSMHASFFEFDHEAAALKEEWRGTSHYIDLNGDWKF